MGKELIVLISRNSAAMGLNICLLACKSKFSDKPLREDNDYFYRLG
ncbi:hypothetical protein [Candidatus Nitrosocosmicus sp. T]